MKKMWFAIIGLVASMSNAQADVYDMAMSFDEDAINIDASRYNEDEIIRLEQMMNEFEFLSAEEQAEAKMQISELVRILVNKGVLMSASLVCAICQDGH